MGNRNNLSRSYRRTASAVIRLLSTSSRSAKAARLRSHPRLSHLSSSCNSTFRKGMPEPINSCGNCMGEDSCQSRTQTDFQPFPSPRYHQILLRFTFWTLGVGVNLTGSGPRRHRLPHKAHQPMNFDTTNGIAHSKTVIDHDARALAEEVIAYCMPSSPDV